MTKKRILFAVICSVSVVLIQAQSDYSSPKSIHTFSGKTSTSQIIADHTVVDQYDKIPQQYIDSVKKLLVHVQGQSHSKGYMTGCKLLELVDSRFAVSTYYINAPQTIVPPSYTDQYLRIGRPWEGAEMVWTSQTRIDDSKTTQIYYPDSSLQYDAYIFGWSYQATWDNPPGGTIDPVYNVHWAGRTASGPDGSKRWGLDAGDSILTGNRVCVDTYLDAMEQWTAYSAVHYPKTHIIFSTLIVDGHEGTEDAFQRELKSQHIRDYVKAHEGKILFDFGDILTHSNAGEAYMVNWNDGGTIRPHNQIHPENLMDYNASWNIIPAEPDPDEDHIGEVGALRLGKAMWWMLARIKGWDGIVTAIPENDKKAGFSIVQLPDKIMIESENLSNDFISCSVYSTNGALIRHEKTVNNSIELEKSSLASGIYIVVFTGMQQVISFKIAIP